MAKNKQESTEDEIILVEFDSGAGLQPVSISDNLTEMAEKSSEAVSKAMMTIRHMAVRTIESVKKLSDPPDAVEVQFGIKLDAEAGALVAKAGTEASINVKLTWRSEDKPSEKPPYVTGLVPPTEK